MKLGDEVEGKRCPNADDFAKCVSRNAYNQGTNHHRRFHVVCPGDISMQQDISQKEKQNAVRKLSGCQKHLLLYTTLMDAD